MTPSSHLRVRPSVELLEDRDVPSVAEAVQEVQLIRGVIPAIRDNLPALVQIPEFGDILQTLRDTSDRNYQELLEFQQEVIETASAQIQALEQQRIASNQQIMDEYNAGIALADAAVAALDPATQQAIAGAVAQYKLALGADAQAKIVRTGDIIGGQEVFSIEYASQLNTILVPIIVQSVDNFVQSDQLVQAFGASPAPSGGGGNQTCGLITTLGPNYELDVVGFDSRFQEGICSVDEYTRLVQRGEQPPNVIDPATGLPPPTS